MEMAITLPATYQEAEAEAFAREKFACFKQEGSPWGGHSPLAPEATRVWFRQMLQIGLHGAANRMRIVAGAKAGDADYVALLKGVLLEAKSARRMDQLPTEIIDYDMWITAHGEQRMRRSEKRDYVIRDICVSLVVAALDDKFGIRPTGHSARRRSGCEIVGEALFEGGAATAGKRHRKKSYETVKKIWGKYKNAMPTVPGWAADW